MQVVFLCTEPGVAACVRDALGPSVPLHLARDWGDFERTAPTATLLGAHLPHPAAALLAPPLARLRSRHPATPLVVLTPRDPDAMRHLLNVGVTELVWCEDAAAELAATFARLRPHSVATRIALRIESSAVEPACLRAALARAVRAPRPPTRVGELAALAHCDRTTLWRWWQGAVGSSGLKLNHFLAWVLLIHAVERRQGGRKWTAVADELGIHEHTLARLARRCTRLTLAGVQGVDSIALLRRFEADVLEAFAAGAKQSTYYPQQIAVEAA